MRRLATIRVIDEVQPIPDADAIEKVRLGGWWCVCKKGEFKPGDKSVYFEIDSLLPPVEPFTFLEKGGRKRTLYEGKEYEGYRLRTVKLRGQISQGLALPLGLFAGKIEGSIPVDEDLSDQLGIVKYEPPVPVNLKGEVKGPMPGYIPKSDEERLQNCVDILTTHRGASFSVTEKLDGTSATFYKYRGGFGVCGRNWEYKEDEENLYWRMARKYGLAERIPDGHALQCELIGEGVQGNPLKIKGQEARLFYAFQIDEHKYLETQEMIALGQSLGIATVPLVEGRFVLNHSAEQLLEMANRKSLLNPTCDCEGLVFRLNGAESKVSFKVISNRYLLKHE